MIELTLVVLVITVLAQSFWIAHVQRKINRLENMVLGHD